MNHASSRRTRFGSSWSLLIMLLIGASTAAAPKSALRLPESTLEVRSMQTRTLEAPTENDILIATIAVLQDMEFNLDRIEKPLGVITASKLVDADSSSEKVGLFFMDLLCAASNSFSCHAMSGAQDNQNIILTMVVLPSLARTDEFTARVTLQRIVYDKMDRVKVAESIEDPQIYQDIFSNMRKSLFIQVSQQ